MTIDQESLELHKKLQGKIEMRSKVSIESRHDLSLSYTPGVAAVSNAIAKDKNLVWEYTNRKNTIAVVTDGSAVLGLGNIGPEAALPVMEGKAVLFKEFAGIDAVPICLSTQNTEEIIGAIKAIAPSFAGINLEDISAPRCFEVEERLKKELSIPVFHDDQHGTAIVVLAGILNALKALGKEGRDQKIVISGVGAAGTAIAKLLTLEGFTKIIMVDSKGVISLNRTDLNDEKKKIAATTNPDNFEGSLTDAIQGSDIFIGVSAPGIVSQDMVKSMNPQPIIFSLANPTPEIMPDEAKAAGAAIVATGRSDFPNQINNVLAFPGIFRGAIDAGITEIGDDIKKVAAYALASMVQDPEVERLLPDALDRTVAPTISKAIVDYIRSKDNRV